MASLEAARALAETVRTLRDQVEALEDPERVTLLDLVKRAKDQSDVIVRRAQSEAARAQSGVGAAPRFMRAY